jgi:hypothetical protein
VTITLRSCTSAWRRTSAALRRASSSSRNASRLCPARGKASSPLASVARAARVASSPSSLARSRRAATLWWSQGRWFGARGVHKLDPPANQHTRRRDRVNAPVGFEKAVTRSREGRGGGVASASLSFGGRVCCGRLRTWSFVDCSNW